MKHFFLAFSDEKMISSDKVAAKLCAENHKIELTSENMKELVNRYYDENDASASSEEIHRAQRKKEKEKIHKIAQEEMEQILETASSEDPLRIIIENTKILPKEGREYLEIAMKHGVPLNHKSDTAISLKGQGQNHKAGENERPT